MNVGTGAHRFVLCAAATAVGLVPCARVDAIDWPPDLPEPEPLPDTDALIQFPETYEEFHSRYPNHVVRQGPFRRPDLDGDGLGDHIFPRVGFDENIPRIGSVSLRSRWMARQLFVVTGEQPNDMFGWVADSAGDFNGDGHDDLLVTAPNYGEFDQGSGRAYIYSGADGSLLARISTNVQLSGLGLAASSLGDVDGDGFDDIALGAPTGADSPGYVAVIHGRAAAAQGHHELSIADSALFLLGEESGDAFGFSVASAGDFNGDGQRDFVVGAPGHERGVDGNDLALGAAYVYSGATGALLLKMIGSAPGEQFGAIVQLAGDLDGDFKSDILVATAGLLEIDPDGNIANNSAVHRFNGRAEMDPASVLTSAQSDQVLLPSVPDDFLFGADIEFARDLDGDNRPEIIIDASFIDVIGGEAVLRSRSYVYSGDEAGLLGTFSDFDEFEALPFGGPGAAADPPGDGGEGGEGGGDAGFLTGDIDGDGDVDQDDLYALLMRVGQATCCRVLGDLDGNGMVDTVDLALLIGNYGASGGAVRPSSDLNGDGVVCHKDMAIVIAEIERLALGGAPQLSPAEDVTGDGVVDKEDVAQIIEMATDGELDSICDDVLVYFGDLDELAEECDGLDGEIEGPDFPGPDGGGGEDDCDELPRTTISECGAWAACMVSSEFDEVLDAIEARLDEIGVEISQARLDFDVVQDGPLNDALIAAATAAQIEVQNAQDRAADKAETEMNAAARTRDRRMAGVTGVAGVTILFGGPIGLVGSVGLI